MQTSKEKAQELYNKWIELYVGNKMAKAICIACVDEIIKANPIRIVEVNHPYGNWEQKEDNTDYWQQVKEELQKM